MQDRLVDLVAKATSTGVVERGEVIQSLWSGYGEIVRYHLNGAEKSSVIVKHVRYPDAVNHPRGWHNDHAHQRKLSFCEVEMHWYQSWSKKCDVLHLLSSAVFQTFVHGDAKLANFCFSSDCTRVTAVDFQYVGGGCGMKDVAKVDIGVKALATTPRKTTKRQQGVSNIPLRFADVLFRPGDYACADEDGIAVSTEALLPDAQFTE